MILLSRAISGEAILQSACVRRADQLDEPLNDLPCQHQKDSGYYDPYSTPWVRRMLINQLDVKLCCLEKADMAAQAGLQAEIAAAIPMGYDGVDENAYKM